jgi:SAM-dependent methyltransferase
MTGPGDITLAAYQGAAGEYLRNSARPAPEQIAYLDRFAALVGSGSVLEIGSGPGWDADHLEFRGLRVVRTDAAPAFVERLRAAGHDARLLDVRTGELGGPYQALLANAVLPHLDRGQFEDVLRRARRAVVAEGTLGFTLKEGDGAAWSDHKLGLPRHFTYWREPAVRVVLRRTGWRVDFIDHVAVRENYWLRVLARPDGGARGRA